MINSTANKQIRNIVALQTKSKERTRQDCFIIEGIKMFQEAPADRIIKSYLTGACLEAMDEKEKKKLWETGSELVSEEVFRRISDTVTPQGILTIVRKKEEELATLLKQPHERDNLFVLLEDLQDPGNLGTIIRTAEAAGAFAVIMSKGTVDVYNPKVVRSTMGTIFRVPLVRTEDLGQSMDLLKEHGVRIYAAHLSGKDDYDQKDYRKPSAFVIGNEGKGISDAIAAKADERIRIPMAGRVESLNAACAATILMYEHFRQNR